ncbi:ORF V: Enzymatic polyprotein [Labeo rohita]|uniref:ribonuclease H n=1 Tax=Labeo rohita TaxID=84645 RepID=A0ABQ8LF45_LABRO|nr:ORF V: Enzymatic polyprotein [Labeo rohita]
MSKCEYGHRLLLPAANRHANSKRSLGMKLFYHMIFRKISYCILDISKSIYSLRVLQCIDVYGEVFIHQSLRSTKSVVSCGGADTFAFGASSSELFKTEKKKEKEFLSSHSLCWRAAELLKELHLKERSAAASLILRAAVFTASTPPALQRAPRLSARLCRGFSLGGPGFQKSEFLAAVEDIFPVCLSGRALPGAVVSSPLWTDVIAVSRAWAESTLRQRSRMSRCSFMSRHPLLSSRGKSLSRQGFSAAAARHLGDIQVTMQNVPSAPKAPRTSASPRSPVELPKQYTSPYSGLGISFCAPQEVEMSAAASEGESDDEADDSAGRYPSAVATPSETDAELSAMLLRAAKEIGLEVPKTPPADPSRLDDWFLGRAPAAPPRSPPVPFFPEVHEELLLSPPLDGGAARGYEAVPQVERAVAVHLCPPGAATWRDRPHLPSRACEFSSALAGRTYHAAGQAATALHAMATLQVYQAKVLKHLHERGSDQGAMEELRAATDFPLRATKVTARSLGQVMSTIVVQERHLWLTLAQMADVDKSRFLDAPISQGGLFGDTVEDFAQQFSAVQKQTEAIKHILPRRDIPTMSAGPQPPPARRRGRPPAASKQPAPSPAKVHDPRLAARRRAGRGRAAPPASQGPVTRKRSAKRGENRSLGDDNINVPTPGGGPGAVTERVNSLTSGVQAPSSLFEQRPESASSDSDSEPDVASAGTREEGKRCPVQSDFSPGRSSFWDQSPSPSPPRLPHCGHVGQRPFDTPGDQAGSLASASQPLAVVDSDGTSRLCDSVRQASAQVQRRPFHFCPFGHTCRCASCGGCSPTGEGRTEPVPPAEMKSGFYSPYFIVPKKSGGLRPILDLRALNRSLLRLPFKMLTTKRMLTCIRPQDWFAAIDLKDAYFHVSILPRHRPFLRFAFEGRAYQYKVLPFGLSLSPRVFTKVAEAALSPLWQTGIRILNYLDDWLLIAHSRDLLCEQRDLVLRHLSHLGLQVNREKSKLSPVQRISFLGVELDSVSMTARLTNERAQSVLKCLESFRHKTAVPLKTFQRLLGHMAAAAAVTPLGLLHMRPLQRWLHDRVPRWAWHRGTLRIGVSPQCRRLFSPWSDPAFLQAGVPLGQVSRHLVVYTDASSTGWGAVCNGQAASGSWTGPRLQWHINCLELLAVLLALRRFRPTLRHKHVLVRTDSTATVAYINRQGGLRSRRMRTQPCSRPALTAVHPSWRMATPPRDSPANLEPFREAQIDLFASPNPPTASGSTPSTRLPTASAGTHAHSWPPGPKYAFPPVSLLAQTLCKIREDEEQVLLVAPYWPTRTWFPELISLAAAPPWKIPLRRDLLSQGMGTIWHPRPICGTCTSGSWTGRVRPLRPFTGRDRNYHSVQSPLYKAGLCAEMGSVRRLVFLSRGGPTEMYDCSSAFLPARKVGAQAVPFNSQSVRCCHCSVPRCSGWNIPRPHPIPSWDLSVALQGLREAPFEPLASVELKYLSLKTALLTALASIKRVGDLQAFSVDEACLEFGPGDSHVILRPRPGYVPKVPTTPFRDQVVNLQALPLEEADPASALLCPVRALRIYVDRTRHFRRTEQLFVCFGGQQKGNAVSKQRLAHWVVDAISLSYQNQGEPCPLGVRAHSTRSVASSYALAHGASLADICRAADITGERESGWCRLAAPFLMDPCAISLGCSLRRTWVLHAPQSGLVRSSACLCSGWVSFAQQRFHVLPPPTPASVQLASLWGPYWPPGRWEGYAHIRLLTRPPVGTRETTEGERLGYVRNPRSLKEGTETLHPLPRPDVALTPGCSSAPQQKPE